jgi:large subunit ribosomal protein L6
MSFEEGCRPMSRVGKMPLAIPQGVDVLLNSEEILVKGPLGTLVRALNPLVTVKKETDVLVVSSAHHSPEADAMSGTVRALLANMVTGVSKGFEKKLQLVGVGFRAQAQAQKLTLQIGFSHTVDKEMPRGVRVECPSQVEIVIKGVDRQVVGQVAAEVRAARSPEPYKGKGIRYSDEKVTLKETKKK